MQHFGVLSVKTKCHSTNTYRKTLVNHKSDFLTALSIFNSYVMDPVGFPKNYKLNSKAMTRSCSSSRLQLRIRHP